MGTTVPFDTASRPALVIDCDTCELQGTDACHDCVVTFLCGHEPGEAVLIEADDVHALRLLHQGGLAPALRHRRRTG